MHNVIQLLNVTMYRSVTQRINVAKFIHPAANAK